MKQNSIEEKTFKNLKSIQIFPNYYFWVRLSSITKNLSITQNFKNSKFPKKEKKRKIVLPLNLNHCDDSPRGLTQFYGFYTCEFH